MSVPSDMINRLGAAISKGRLNEVKQVLRTFKYARFTIPTELLCTAIKLDRAKIAEELMNNGCRVNNHKTNCNTPLHFAIWHGNVKLITIMLSRGANLTAQNEDGFYPLHLAIRSLRQEVVELLLNRGAPVDFYSIATIEVDDKIPNHNFKTPLMLAVELCSWEIVELLLGRAADVNRKFNGATPLHTASAHGNLKMCKLLVRFDADINCLDSEGKSPLFVAVEAGKLKTAMYLLEENAAVNVKTNNNITPIFTAAVSGNKELIELLLDNDAEIDTHMTDTRQKPILHHAVENGCLELVDRILTNCNVLKEQYPDLLRVAILKANSCSKIYRLLVKFGFRLNENDAQDRKIASIKIEKGL